jgi:sugar/nucleoside kinase (ribokinase family)
LLFGDNGQFFSCPAFPLEDIHDPTGAGDTFAGGLAGYLAKYRLKVEFSALRRAVVHGSILASYNVEAFSLERLKAVTRDEISERFDTFRRLSQFDTD